MAGPLPSYYFTLFKKFQMIGHVEEKSTHGGPGPFFGGFDLNDPNSVLSATVTTLSGSSGTLLGPNHANSPLWAMLNSAATGGPDPIPVGGIQWDQMPPSWAPTPPAWTDFQVGAPAPKLLDVFASWIDAGKVNDIPAGVIATQPPTIGAPPDPGVSPFVCSFAGDDGTRPGGVPGNYWDTSLIFLVDPSSGNIVTPSVLSGGSEYFLTAVIGNRGQNAGGVYSLGGVTVEGKGIVMVWNTTFGPGVELPSLSNLDVNSDSSLYEQYFLDAGQYDVVGFRLDVQTVYDGIIAAVNQAVSNGMLNLGGQTADQWVKAGHLCAKVVVRQGADSFPNVGDIPINSNRIAQKNLAPFDVSLAVVSPDPNIIWKNFILGQPFFVKLGQGEGRNTLILEESLSREAFRLFIALTRDTFERYFGEGGGGGFKGFRVVPDEELCESELGERAKPFPEAVVLRYLGGENAIELPALGDEELLGMSLGIEYSVRRLKPGPAGRVTLVHKALIPRLIPGTCCFEIESVTAGGFTIVVGAKGPLRGGPPNDET